MYIVTSIVVSISLLKDFSIQYPLIFFLGNFKRLKLKSSTEIPLQNTTTGDTIAYFIVIISSIKRGQEILTGLTLFRMGGQKGHLLHNFPLNFSKRYNMSFLP